MNGSGLTCKIFQLLSPGNEESMQLPPKTRGHNNNLDIIYLDTVLFFGDYSSTRPSMTYILHKNGRELGSLFKKTRSVRNFGLIILIAYSNSKNLNCT